MKVARDGSMVTFLPESGAERAWFDEYVAAEPWQWLGSALVVDIRFAAGAALKIQEIEVLKPLSVADMLQQGGEKQ